ncbi:MULTISPECIES: response regulator [unclassified Sulfurimonas]|uniref:response regulator n=1 Tax=unclassified Sulfurimonas TaxID=2623549 RepID=UPI0032046749
MGIFSLFSKQKNTHVYDTGKKKETLFSQLDKDFFIEVADSSDTMMLYFLQGEGWIGANKTFFTTMNYFDIKDFKRANESIRDMFLSESEEIFTESDKSWLDYIKKYKSDGYRVNMTDAKGQLLSIEAKCHRYSKNMKLYILELKDVTELEKARLQVKEVEKLKTKFLANIGHEFRTPMNGILGFIELLKETSLNEHQNEYLDMIDYSSKNLMNNIESLLDLAQLQSGRLTVESEPFNLLVAMEKLIYTCFDKASNNGVQVMSFIDPKLPQELEGDANKILQVMRSIIQNAIKFTPHGGKVIIEVKLLKRLQNGACSVGFSVKDNGQGMSQEQISLMDEPFTAGSHADERLGIGLSLSSGLVRLMGSELRIKSELDNGTYVNFVLDFKASRGQNYKMMPNKKAKVLLLDKEKVDDANFLTTYLRSFAIDVTKSSELNADIYTDIDELYVVGDQGDSSWILDLATYKKQAPVVFLLDEDEKLQTKMTHIIDEVIEKPLLASVIAKHLYMANSYKYTNEDKNELTLKDKTEALVVEDNLINQRLIKILLEEYNIDVSTASNGLEAVKMYKEKKYDIIFMDIDMPYMNGIVATKEIKDMMLLKSQAPIVALTAMAMEGDKEMLLEEGLDDYLSKPLTRDKLEYILDKYLKISYENESV